MKASRLCSLLFLSWGLGTAISAGAASYTESGDAGELVGTAQAVGPGVSSILGTISSESGTGFVDVDVYRLELPAGDLSAQVTSSVSNPTSGFDLDTALVLFDGFGVALRADDDGASSAICDFCARVEHTLAVPGTYYLAVLDVVDVIGPVSGAGLIWDPDLRLVENGAPNGPGAGLPWIGWTALAAPDYVGGSYTVALSLTTVPVPAALPLPGGALAWLGFFSVRGRRPRQ